MYPAVLDRYNNMYKKLKLIFFLLLFFFIFQYSTFAFIFSPPIVDLNIPAGGSKEFTLTVINESEESINLRLYLTDIKRTSNGELQFPSAGTMKYSCAKDITLELKSITVPPLEKIEVKVKINLPYHAQGGKYAVIMCEEVSEQVNDGIVVAPRWRIGSVVRVMVMGRQKKGFRIGEIIHHPPSKKEGRRFIIPIRNNGNIHLNEGKGYLLTMDKDKRIVERILLNVNNMIFPESEVHFTLVSNRSLPQGEYITKATIEFQGIRTISKEQKFAVESDMNVDGKHEENFLNLEIVPPEVTLSLPSGGYRTVGLRIKNQEDLPFQLQMEFKDISYNNKGEPQLLDFGSTPYTLKDIITITPKEFLLAPLRGMRNVRFSFTIPRTISGGLYGTLIIKAHSVGKGFILSGEKEVDIAVSITNTEKPSLKINKVNITPNEKQIHIFLELFNDGNILLKPEGEVKISNMQFEEVRRSSFERLSVLPGRSLELISTCSSLPSGRYKVTIKIDYGIKDSILFWNEEIKIK